MAETPVPPERHGITDIEYVVKLIEHVNAPCETVVEGKRKTIRKFYMRLLREAIPTLENPHARELAEKTLERYKDEE